MFAKLLKHEFKSQAKLMLILSLAALGAGVVGGGMLALFMHLIESEMDTTGAIIGTVFSMMIMIFMIFAIVAYSMAVMILLAYRFYKHHFSDEGYLTFTLPASSHQILLSGILNFLIWQVIASVVAFVSIMVIMTPVFTMLIQETGMPQMIFSESFLEVMYADMGVDYSGWYILLQILSMVISYVGAAVLILTSITIGSVVAKKHKILASIGIYYGINMAMSIVTNIISFVGMMGDAWVAESTGMFSMTWSMLIPALLYLGIAIGGYFLMHHLVDKKLNLP